MIKILDNYRFSKTASCLGEKLEEILFAAYQIYAACDESTLEDSAKMLRLQINIMIKGLSDVIYGRFSC